MIRTRNKTSEMRKDADGPARKAAAAAADEVGEWEVRPGGMLVQKRIPDSESAVAAAAAAAVPTIRVKVKYESAYYEIYLSSQSTFGELKKLVAERTGVHHQDQKVLYKDKVRENGAYLDACGVKDRSKLVMLADPTAHARRLLQMRRDALLDRATSSLKEVAAKVDKLSGQVRDMESMVRKGREVADKEILNLTEQLMTQLIRLDGIAADVDKDIKLQRGIQVRRVQKHVEMLDVLKIKNAKIATVSQQQQQQQQQKRQHQPQASVLVTTEWEMFDSLFAPSSTPSAPASYTTTTSSSSASSSSAHTSHWQLL